MDQGLQSSEVRKVPEGGPKAQMRTQVPPPLPVQHFRIPGHNLDASVGDEGAGTKL